jgi:hypothetical protein
METFATPQPTQPVVESKPTNWPKIILAAIVGFGLLVSAAYAGYWFGTQQEQLSKELYPSMTPEKVTESFYNWYISYRAAGGNLEVYKTSEYVSNELIRKLEGVVGYDPVLCAQNIPESVTVGKATVSEGNASVAVTESFIGTPSLKVDLKLLNNKWRITDIICPIP